MKLTPALLALALVLSACTTGDSQGAATAHQENPAVAPTSPDDTPSRDDDEADDDLSELEAVGDIEVDRGLLSVEVTIPASLAEEANIDQVVADFAEDGIRITDARRNSDGSITYKMSRADHRRLLTTLRESFEETFAETSADFPSVQSITFNSDLTRFRMVVDRAAFENSFDGFVVFLPLFAAGIYAAFDGRDPEGMRIEIDYVDAATGQVFDTFIAPDDLQD